MQVLSVAIGGLGAVGLQVARALDRGIEGLRLVAVSARDKNSAARNLADFSSAIEIVPLEDLAEHAAIIVECVAASEFDRIAIPAIDLGRIFIPLTASALLSRGELIKRCRKTGARIVVPSGAILGLDAIRAAAEGQIRQVTIVTSKPPSSLAGAPYLIRHGIDVTAFDKPLRVFEGPVREAARRFPANVNVAAAVSLAGIGPDHTYMEIWADPALSRGTHRVDVVSDSSDFSMTISGIPSERNPRTGRITPQSVVATLRRITDPLVVGS